MYIYIYLITCIFVVSHNLKKYEPDRFVLEHAIARLPVQPQLPRRAGHPQRNPLWSRLRCQNPISACSRDDAALPIPITTGCEGECGDGCDETA